MAVSKDLKIKGGRKEEWTLEKIEQEMINLGDQPNPALVQEWRMWLSVEYAHKSAMLPALKKKEAEKWFELKKETKSIKETDEKLKTTKEYLHRATIELQLKAIEKLLSALRTQLEIWNVESYGNY